LTAFVLGFSVVDSTSFGFGDGLDTGFASVGFKACSSRIL
jgi:hypothetical protein